MLSQVVILKHWGDSSLLSAQLHCLHIVPPMSLILIVWKYTYDGINIVLVIVVNCQDLSDKFTQQC